MELFAKIVDGLKLLTFWRKLHSFIAYRNFRYYSCLIDTIEQSNTSFQVLFWKCATEVTGLILCNYLQRHSCQCAEMLRESAVNVCRVFIRHQCQLFSSYRLTSEFFALNCLPLTNDQHGFRTRLSGILLRCPLGMSYLYHFFLDLLIWLNSCLVWSKSKLKRFFWR